MRTRNGRPARVLIVEDEPEILRLEQRILEEAGLEVTQAERVGEALERLRNERYAVVVADLFVMRGQESVESIGALVQAAGETPVIVVSGWPVEEEEARAAGVVSVVRKPFEVQELVEVVEQALEGKG